MALYRLLHISFSPTSFLSTLFISWEVYVCLATAIVSILSLHFGAMEKFRLGMVDDYKQNFVFIFFLLPHTGMEMSIIIIVTSHPTIFRNQREGEEHGGWYRKSELSIGRS